MRNNLQSNKTADAKRDPSKISNNILTQSHFREETNTYLLNDEVPDEKQTPSHAISESGANQ